MANTPPRSDDPEKPADEPRSKKIGRIIIVTITLLILLGLCVSVIYFIVLFWPGAVCAESCHHTSCYLGYDQRFFVLVALGGALGAFIHATTSFVDFTGNKKLVYSWLPWYIVRPFIGSALAIIFYFVIRGGLITTQLPISEHPRDSTDSDKSQVDTTAAESPNDTTDTSMLAEEVVSESSEGSTTEEPPPPPPKPKQESTPLNPYGIMAIACLAGMFSKQATDKLREVFQTLFQIKEETPRYDKLNNSGKPTTGTALPPADDNADGDTGEKPQA